MTSATKRLLKIDSIGTPASWHTEGRKIPYAGFGEPVTFHVRSLVNPEYKRALAAAQAENAKIYGADVPEDVAISGIGSLLAEHILLGWEGLDIEYSKDIAAMLLGDAAYKLLTVAVLMSAETAGIPRVEFVDAPPVVEAAEGKEAA